MEMARICRERFENVKNAYAYMILDINILSYQYKIFTTVRSKKNKAREYKKYKRTYVLYLQPRFIIVGTNVMMIFRFLPYKL